jgi:hypothetical protein
MAYASTMKRTDSGFHESLHSRASRDGVASLRRRNTAPISHRKSTNTIAGSGTTQTTNMELQRPASEERSRPSRQRTTTSSSENSTSRSRGHGRGSKPSSRGTSCTIVDLSRPARHYRMQSSHTLPAATSRDIDDVLALHFRSCSLFQNPSIHTSPLSPAGHFGFSSAASRFSTDNRDVCDIQNVPTQDEDSLEEPKKTSATMHWTSPGTRKRDYKRIDKANSGFRGFLNKVMPRCVSGPQEKFYEEDQSDACSVRRYRLDDGYGVEEEKDHNLNDRNSSRTPDGSVESFQATSRKWTCF